MAYDYQESQRKTRSSRPSEDSDTGRSWIRLGAIALVLLVIPAYIVFISALPATVAANCESSGQVRGVTDQVGFCERIGFTVIRPYYAGLLKLPVYAAGIDFNLLNKTFLPVLLVVALALWFRKPL